MNIAGIIVATAIIAITGLAIGLLLGIAGVKFRVEVDEKEVRVRELLPGNNCGGCGYAGCDALAKAITLGETPADACPVAGAAASKAIAAVMGVDVTEKVKEVAFVKCVGTCDRTNIKYNYFGEPDCKKAALVPGRGGKMCSYGCMGYGSCITVCLFDAIHIVDGVAVVNKDKCVSCKKCIEQCPNQLIELVPYSAVYRVQCSSRDKGKDVKAACSIGCIGCGICAKNCKVEAITLESNLAYIDQTKCVSCGVCAEKCPVKVIG